MSKNIKFTANEPITVEQMNSLVQDSQIQQELGDAETELMSQGAIKKSINNICTDVKFNAIPELGNATTIDEALKYIAGVFNGNNAVNKISVREINLVD